MLAERLKKAWSVRRGSNAIDVVMRFSDEGLVLGAGTLLAKSGASSRSLSIDPTEPRFVALLAAAHMRTPTRQSLAHLRNAAERWSEGQEALAAMHLALSRLERLERPEADARRLFLADGLLSAGFEAAAIVRAIEAGVPAFAHLEKYNPDQPRVPAGSGRTSGEWSSAGDGSAASDDAGNPSSLLTPAELVPPPQPLGPCDFALEDCIEAALNASSNDPPGDNARSIDTANCIASSVACDGMSAAAKLLPFFPSGGVIFPHKGVVKIAPGRPDRYFPPLPGGRPPYFPRGA